MTTPTNTATISILQSSIKTELKPMRRTGFRISILQSSIKTITSKKNLGDSLDFNSTKFD